MKRTNLKFFAIGIAMLVAAGLSFALVPRQKIADKGPKVNLEMLIPKQFGGWELDESVANAAIRPYLKGILDKVYSQTLSRTYVNAQGQRIMLSIAYGGDQSRSMQVHQPESCYPAQGFQIEKQEFDNLNTGFGTIPIRRLVASQGPRVEPLTYWIKTGDMVTGNTSSRQLARLKYGLTGQVPDGLLFRVSSISRADREAFVMQELFIKALLNAVSPQQREFLVGKAPA
jgi:EpsI family protein